MRLRWFVQLQQLTLESFKNGQVIPVHFYLNNSLLLIPPNSPPPQEGNQRAKRSNEAKTNDEQTYRDAVC